MGLLCDDRQFFVSENYAPLFVSSSPSRMSLLCVTIDNYFGTTTSVYIHIRIYIAAGRELMR